MASTEQIAMEYYNKGVHCLVTNDLENGVECMKMAEAIFLELGDDTNYIKTLRFLCVGYSLMNANSLMIQVLLKGIQYCDSHQIKGAKHLFYTNICDRYMTLADYDSAINYGLMAVQDFEANGEFFDNTPSTYLVGYLNLSFSYLKTRRYREAELYMFKTKTIADKNDIHSHDFSLDCIAATLHHAGGDDAYVHEHKSELMNFVKSVNVTMDDYVGDISTLVELFCDMKLYEDALEVVHNLALTVDAENNVAMKLETSKLYMYIYKHNGEKEKYNSACVGYAESAIQLERTKACSLLADMDTAIALSIASTPLDFL